jgi:UDP-glucuronate 4-epimerase
VQGETHPRVLVTGPAGFIGFFLSRRLLERNVVVLGFDNMSPYYDVRLNEARLAQLERLSGFSFIRGDPSCSAGSAVLARESAWLLRGQQHRGLLARARGLSPP